VFKGCGLFAVMCKVPGRCCVLTLWLLWLITLEISLGTNVQITPQLLSIGRQITISVEVTVITVRWRCSVWMMVLLLSEFLSRSAAQGGLIKWTRYQYLVYMHGRFDLHCIHLGVCRVPASALTYCRPPK